MSENSSWSGRYIVFAPFLVPLLSCPECVNASRRIHGQLMAGGFCFCFCYGAPSTAVVDACPPRLWLLAASGCRSVLYSSSLFLSAPFETVLSFLMPLAACMDNWSQVGSIVLCYGALLLPWSQPARPSGAFWQRLNGALSGLSITLR
jgi:hypothetical protein